MDLIAPENNQSMENGERCYVCRIGFLLEVSVPPAVAPKVLVIVLVGHSLAQLLLKEVPIKQQLAKVPVGILVSILSKKDLCF